MKEESEYFEEEIEEEIEEEVVENDHHPVQEQRASSEHPEPSQEVLNQTNSQESEKEISVH